MAQGFLYHRQICVTLNILVSVMNLMGGPYSTYGDKRGVYRVYVRKPEGKRPLVRPRLRWEDNIKMDLQEVGLGHGLN